MHHTILKTGLFLITLLSLNATLHAQVTTTVDPLAPGENIYRHFTGTVGDHKAVLDLRYGYQTASNFGGSTCYFADDSGLQFFLISRPTTTAHTEVLRAQIFPENLPLGEIKDAYSAFVQTSRFEFTLSHDSLVGKWYIPNAQQGITVTLTEDNTSGLPFLFKYAADSTTVTGKNGEAIKAVATYSGVQPSPKMKEKDVAFINNAVAQFMGATGNKPNAADDMARACFQQFFSGLNAVIKKGEQPGGSNFSGIFTFFPVYNDKGFLVFQLGGYQYDFANKEYTDRNRYLCLDVKNKKTLKLDDILVQNNDLLSGLLAKSFRVKYRLEPGKKLSDLFMGDKMPLTDNFMIVNKGLLFSYYPAKIFRDTEDIAELQEMRLFLSFEELRSMLKPDFINRIGLK